jgi:hypothetical protein
MAGKQDEVFSRKHTEEGNVTPEIGEVLYSLENRRVRELLGAVDFRPNQLLLNAIYETLNKKSFGPVFSPVLQWFHHGVDVIQPDTEYESLVDLISKDSEFAKFAGDFLRQASTGVSDLKYESRVFDRKNSPLPWDFLERIAKSAERSDPIFLRGPYGSEIRLNKQDGTLRIEMIKTGHLTAKGSRAELPLHEESDGTQRLLQLLPALFQLNKEPKVYFIDELDRSMHPLIAWEFLRAFLEKCEGCQHQLILTTHECHLLDLELLRRDEIWFAEKNKHGATILYPLTDFNIRKDLKISKGYLQGRFGAIPFFGEPNLLIGKPCD